MTEQLETPLIFDCEGERLVSILHEPRGCTAIGVVIVVGGPQYRVGSHRQFVLLARKIAAAGFPVLRFDYRGMGDSDGSQRSFEVIEKDVRAAIDALIAAPCDVDRVVLMGLCDAASAISMYCSGDRRVTGVILLNPWARTEEGQANAYLQHYYGKRLLQKSFWMKVLSGRYAFLQSTRDFFRSIRLVRTRGGTAGNPAAAPVSYIARMQDGLARFGGRMLVLISGQDLTAQEFMDMCQRSPAWRAIVYGQLADIKAFPPADHTLSRRAHLDEVNQACVAWLEALVSNE